MHLILRMREIRGGKCGLRLRAQSGDLRIVQRELTELLTQPAGFVTQAAAVRDYGYAR